MFRAGLFPASSQVGAGDWGSGDPHCGRCWKMSTDDDEVGGSRRHGRAPWGLRVSSPLPTRIHTLPRSLSPGPWRPCRRPPFPQKALVICRRAFPSASFPSEHQCPSLYFNSSPCCLETDSSSKNDREGMQANLSAYPNTPTRFCAPKAREASV